MKMVVSAVAPLEWVTDREACEGIHCDAKSAQCLHLGGGHAGSTRGKIL